MMLFDELPSREPKVMTPEEIVKYLSLPEQERDPLWLQWSTGAATGGWILSHVVSDLMWKYESTYRRHWVLWTRRPSPEQQAQVPWIE